MDRLCYHYFLTLFCNLTRMVCKVVLRLAMTISRQNLPFARCPEHLKGGLRGPYDRRIMC